MSKPTRIHVERAPESEAERLLRDSPLTTAEIASLCGVSGETVRRWRTGAKVPHDRRGALEKHLGIAGCLWERAPRSPSPAEALAAKIDPQALPSDAEGLGALVAQLQAARSEPGLSAVTLSRLAGVEVRAREAHAKCRTWDEQAILRSPVWERVEAAILGALEPPPDADDEQKQLYAGIMRRVADQLLALDAAGVA